MLNIGILLENHHQAKAALCVVLCRISRAWARDSQPSGKMNIVVLTAGLTHMGTRLLSFHLKTRLQSGQ